ncbi:diaminobutyrate acetyltransferase [Bacillus sp. Marseille-P3661]|uniref:diaminobutyrate acetyltransferase n=1 Tax=Bacillus sp. Marseille-P3661 TaxID=1936234 RepID=UPI002155B026|nr:diaminobutyrate acetyltransferase [Bacillus sp. Marseille-P3661]
MSTESTITTNSNSVLVQEKEITIDFVNPNAKDGSSMWKLVKESGALDLNSPYSYLMMSKYFENTCIVAKHEEQLAGFVTAFIMPNQPDTVFVWQIGVSQQYQGQGIATKILQALLDCESCEDVKFLEATISPSNIASQSLFTGLAKKKNTDVKIFDCFPEEWFPEGNHESELTYRIGPF